MKQNLRIVHVARFIFKKCGTLITSACSITINFLQMAGIASNMGQKLMEVEQGNA